VVWEGVGLKYPLPPYNIVVKGYPPPPKMAFLKKCLAFSAKKCHFFRKYLGPQNIFIKK
jgi:hypothetical protein